MIFFGQIVMLLLLHFLVLLAALPSVLLLLGRQSLYPTISKLLIGGGDEK